MKQSLNLAENYCPSWSTWEVAREIICNAMDAGAHTVETPSSNTLIVTTEAVPSFSELMVIGVSTKRNDEKSIGQFGEGFKLAALVATRMGGTVEVRTPEGLMVFSLEEAQGITDRVLHVNITKRGARARGCETKVRLPGIASVIEGKFATSEGHIPKQKLSDCKVYCKGVFITELAQPSVFDWNVPLELNRDRAVISTYDLKGQIASKFSRGELSVDELKQVLKATGTIEQDSFYNIYEHNVRTVAKPPMQQAWRELYGEKAVIASPKQQVNEIAFAKGYQVIQFREELSYFGILRASDVVTTSDTMIEVQVDSHIIDECHQALDWMDIPATVAFFQDYDGAPLGKAVVDSGICIAWLNEKLAKPGNRKLRLATLAHEVCHIDSRSGDATISFEYKLDEICGRLLDQLIKR